MDIITIRRETPWEVVAWCNQIGLSQSVASTVLDHLYAIAPQVSALGEEEQRFFAFAEKRELKKYVYGDPRSKSTSARKPPSNRGKGTLVGDQLITSPLRHSAQLCAWLSEHAKPLTGGKS